MAQVKWHIDGDYIMACNCDFGCPCNFNARPTPGFCQGVIGFQVREGAYGDVRLDGLKTAVAVKWPAAIHEGNGVAAVYIDRAASPQQRSALGEIVSGKAGGAPFGILAATFSHAQGPHFADIHLKLAGQETEFRVEGAFNVAFQPIRNPVTKVEVFPKVVLPQGFVFKEGDQYTTREFWVTAGPELNFTHFGKCAQLAQVHWQGP